MNKHDILTEEEQLTFVSSNPDWRIEEGKLRADFTLDNFVVAMEVIGEIAEFAEEINHHPSFSNEYNKLTFTLSTHDAGSQITVLDTKLAKQISSVVNNRE